MRILGTLALILGRQDERIDLIRPQFQNENFLKKSVTFNNFICSYLERLPSFKEKVMTIF